MIDISISKQSTVTSKTNKVSKMESSCTVHFTGSIDEINEIYECFQILSNKLNKLKIQKMIEVITDYESR